MSAMGPSPSPHEVLVTGGSGFLGKWLIRRLNGLEIPVRILVRSKKSAEDLTRNFKINSISFGDVTDLPSVEKAVDGCATVFHLAGLIAYTSAEREKMEQVNVGGTENVIKACLKAKALLNFTSSVVSIGASFKQEVLNEESTYNLQSMDFGYFETKRKAEGLVLQATAQQGLVSRITNPSTIYGPGDATKSSRRMQIKVARGELKFFPGSGGVSVADVEDVVQGMILAWQKGRSGQRYILAGDNLSIQQLFNEIAEAAGSSAPKISVPASLLKLFGRGESLAQWFGLSWPMSYENACIATMFHWFDSSKAKKELGYQVRPARESIQRSVAWMKQNNYL